MPNPRLEKIGAAVDHDVIDELLLHGGHADGAHLSVRRLYVVVAMDGLERKPALLDLARNLVYEVRRAPVLMRDAPCVLLSRRGLAPLAVRLLHDGAIDS